MPNIEAPGDIEGGDTGYAADRRRIAFRRQQADSRARSRAQMRRHALAEDHRAVLEALEGARGSDSCSTGGGVSDSSGRIPRTKAPVLRAPAAAMTCPSTTAAARTTPSILRISATHLS